MITRRKAVTFLLLSLVAALGFSIIGMAQDQAAKDPPAEIMTLTETVFKAYSAKDFNLLSSIYGGDVVVIDGFAPYRWIGPNALAEWWADVERWIKDGGVESEVLSNKGTLAWGVVGARAESKSSDREFSRLRSQSWETSGRLKDMPGAV
jgi:ketosteroid isomerase-like protein